MTLVTSWPQFVPRAQPLIKSLAERALGSKSSQEGEWCSFRAICFLASRSIFFCCCCWCPACMAPVYVATQYLRSLSCSTLLPYRHPEKRVLFGPVQPDGSESDTAVIAQPRYNCSRVVLLFPLWLTRADLRKMATPQTKTVVLESDHPYAHNADRKETVRVEGAKKLIISFDDRTR